MSLQHEEPAPGTNLISEDTGLDRALLSRELEPSDQPTPNENALEISVLWGDTVVSEVQVRRRGPVRVGGRTSRPRPALEVDGGFPVDAFNIAVLGDGRATIVVPSQAQVAVRADGVINTTPALTEADVGFPAKTYDLKMGQRIVYKTGTVSVKAEFVRGDAVMGTGRIVDWLYPAIVAISLLLHVFLIVGTYIMSKFDDSAADDLFKNENRVAQMLLRPPEPVKKRKKLDLSGLKSGSKVKGPEGKYARPDKPQKDKMASKAGAPRVDPKKQERDRRIALNSGLLSYLKGDEAGAVSNVFGPGGLGTGINEAMGGLKGPQVGDAGGAGGLGTRGTAPGGGGNSLGIGGLGRGGRGPGRGGDGRLDLGGRDKGRTRILPGRTIIKGGLKKAEIARVIQRNLPRFKFCYDKQLATNPNLDGKISVYFTIAPTGSVARASVVETSMHDDTVEECVLRVMRTLKFPKPKGGGIVFVTYPFIYAAP